MNKKQLHELENLLSEMPGDEVYNLEQVHGMLTAIVIGPDLIMPSEWLPYVFNRKGEMPEFDSMEQVDKLMPLLMEMHNFIINKLNTKKFLPLMGHQVTDEEKKSDPLPWCKGFLGGACFWGEEWLQEEDDDSELLQLITPVIYFLDDAETGKKLRRGKSRAQIINMEKKLIGLIPYCVWNIREYWRNVQSGEVYDDYEPDIEDRPLKIGRNDPCFCGSGKKYKKCCGRGMDN